MITDDVLIKFDTRKLESIQDKEKLLFNIKGSKESFIELVKEIDSDSSLSFINVDEDTKENIHNKLIEIYNTLSNEIEITYTSEPLSPDSINRFKSELNEEYNSHESILVRLAKMSQTYQAKKGLIEKNSTNQLGVFKNLIERKFFVESITTYVGMARGYAESIRNAEDASLLKKIRDCVLEKNPIRSIDPYIEQYKNMDCVLICSYRTRISELFDNWNIEYTHNEMFNELLITPNGKKLPVMHLDGLEDDEMYIVRKEFVTDVSQNLTEIGILTFEYADLATNESSRIEVLGENPNFLESFSNNNEKEAELKKYISTNTYEVLEYSTDCSKVIQYKPE